MARQGLGTTRAVLASLFLASPRSLSMLALETTSPLMVGAFLIGIISIKSLSRGILDE